MTAPANNAENRYIDQVKINGKSYSKNYFNYTDLMKGVHIYFSMSDTPNRQRGTTQDDYPYSFSTPQ